MFAKLPQTFTAPFGLLGDEAKLAFPSQPNGITKLATVRHIPATDAYWEQYFILFDSASEVFSLITPHHIRRALTDAPENVATLIKVVANRLFNSISDHTFPSVAGSSVAAYATSFIKSAGVSQERNATKEVLNCLRILQRVLPVIFEVEGESNAFELEVLWKKEEAPDDAESSEPQFVIEDEDGSDEESEEKPQTPKTPQKNTAKKLLPSLGERLFSAVTDLLFCCGFTLPKSIQVDHHKINYVIWEKGIGSANSLGNTSMYDNNKTEVLRLLVVLLSRQIYIPAGSLFSHPSLFSLYIVQKMPRRDVLTILCSLLNTAMNSSATDTITIGTIAGKLPYNHLVFKGEDPRATLIATSLQVLCVLLDFQSGTAKDHVNENQTTSPTVKTNTFRYFIMKLHRTQDFEYLLNGILNVFEQHMATITNLLPGAKKSVPYMTEIIILFWKLIELNKKFCSFVLESEKSMDLVAYLLFYCVEIKDKPQQHGVCRAISYIVQTLSAESAFGLKLSNPIRVQLPTKWGPVDTAADFVIHAIYSIVATTSGSLTSLYPALIIALSNLAPYFQHISVTASARLIQLFTSFSNPLFLLSDEGHPRLLFFMLEVFSAVIYHHPAENPNITYGILQSRKIFEDLGTFTLARGLREVKRAQLAKEDRVQNAKGKAPVHDIESGDAGAEKARLLESEGAVRNDSEERELDNSASPRTSQGDEAITRSFMSPGTENPYVTDSPVSEKARGKMRERRSLSVDNSIPLDRLPPGLTRNGFVPTQEWVTSWQQGLPLDAVMIFISDVVQKVENMQRHRTVPSADVLKFLSSINLDHVLPNKPPIMARRFIWSDASMVWLTSLIWGEIYVRGMTPLGIWNATNVRLFFVKHTQHQQRQITDTVTNVVGGLLRRTADSMNLNVPFNNHGLTTEEIELLKKGSFQTIEDLLLTPSQDIAKRCKISPLDIGRIKDTVFQAVPLPLQRLDTLDVNEDEQFTTGDEILDSALGGGVRTGMIWEVVGESSAGKTQLALQLSLFVQVPRTLGGLSGSTCYLTTSSKLSTARLLQILECDQTLSSFSSLEHVHTINIPTVASLQYITATTLPSFIEQQRSNPNAKPVRLVVIDALGELFHSESRTTTSTLVERSKNLTTLSATLRELAYTCKIAIVVLNEVIDRFDRPVQEHGDQTDLLYENQSRWFNTAAFFGDSQKEASLGLTWATQVNTRIMLTRTGRRRYLGDQDIPKRRRLDPSPKEDVKQAMEQLPQDSQPTLIRRLAIIFSNVTWPVSLDYIVTERGIIVLPGEKTEQVVNQDISGQTAQHNPGLMSTAGLPADPLVSSNPVPEQELADEQLWATEDNLEDLDWDALEHTLSQVVPQ